MNPSVDKRKMPRMQVDLPACIYWGISNRSWGVNIRNMSIHGLSFQSSRYFSEGTPFELIFPEQKEDPKRKKIQAEVVRCETSNDFAKDKFKIGAKFLFESKFFADQTKTPSMQKNPTVLKPLRPSLPLNITHQEEMVHLDNEGTTHRPACTIRVGELKAEFLQRIQTSQNKETVETLIQIKESRFITSDRTSPESVDLLENFLEDRQDTTFPSSKTLGKLPAKQLSDRR